MQRRGLTVFSWLTTLGLVLSGFGQARADFVTSGSLHFFYATTAQENNTVFGDNNYNSSISGQYHNDTFNSGTGFTTTDAGSVSGSYSVAPTQFSFSFGQQASVVSSNSDPGTYYNEYFGGAEGQIQNLSITIDKASTATITFNPTLNLGTANINATGSSPIATSTLQTGLELMNSSGFDAYVEGYAHYTFSPPYSYPTENYITANTGTGPNVLSDSITFLLAPGTYSVFAYTSDIIDFVNGATGSFTDPSTTGSGIITITAGTPEPSSMALLASGMISVFGVVRLRRRSRQSGRNEGGTCRSARFE